MYAGIRALPNFSNQNYANFTNLAILRYAGGLIEDPTYDPTVNIPTSRLPLHETDLHVGFTESSLTDAVNILNI